MKTKDILNQKHTMLYTVSGYTNGSYQQIVESLRRILIDIPDMIKNKIFKLRELGYGTDEYNKTKKYFPNWIVSGTYPLRKLTDNDTLTWSNIISIDIDKKDNPDVDLISIRKELFNLPYVVAVPKSISGKGIYAIILVEEGQYTKEYYKYISKLWKQQYGLNIDEKCDNIARKRFVGYDEEITKWIKPEDTDIIPWKLKRIEKKEPTKSNQIINDKNLYNISKYKNNSTNTDLTRNAIWKLLNNGYSIDNINSTENKYGVWYHIACDFKHFNDGLEMFIRFSQNSANYNDDIKSITKKYNGAKIESTIEDISRKWCGICKHIYGSQWWKNL